MSVVGGVGLLFVVYRVSLFLGRGGVKRDERDERNGFSGSADLVIFPDFPDFPDSADFPFFSPRRSRRSRRVHGELSVSAPWTPCAPW